MQRQTLKPKLFPRVGDLLYLNTAVAPDTQGTRQSSTRSKYSDDIVPHSAATRLLAAQSRSKVAAASARLGAKERSLAPRCLDGQRRWNRRLWRRLARATEAVAGRPVGRLLPGSAALPRGGELGRCQGGALTAPRCRTISARVTAVQAATLSDSTRPAIGMCTS